MRTQSVSDGHVFFASVSSLPVPVAHALGSQINALTLRKSQEGIYFTGKLLCNRQVQQVTTQNVQRGVRSTVTDDVAGAVILTAESPGALTIG